MKRRLLNLLALLSLLLCLTACVLWVRSRRTYDAFLWRGDPIEEDDGDFTKYRGYAIGGPTA